MILIVDDEDGVRQTAAAILRAYGHAVVTAESGEAALRLLHERSVEISLVLLDSSMPGMSGKELLPRLKAVKPELKVVVSSGFSEEEIVRLFTADLVDGIIKKPYTASGLANAIRSAAQNADGA